MSAASVTDTATRDACPACGRNTARARGIVHGHALLRCRTCGLLYHPRPDFQLEEFYDEQYFQGGRDHGAGYANYLQDGDWYSNRVYSEIRDRLLDAFPGRGRLLDIGCASGFFVNAATRDGWRAEGVDVARSMIEEGQRRGLNLHLGPLADAGFEDGAFDVLTMFHTLEHLTDPRAFLHEARRIAAPDCLFVIEVPNAWSVGRLVRRLRWSQFKPPEHLNYFGPRSLRRSLDATGWKIERTETNYQAEIATYSHTRSRPSLHRPLSLAAASASRLGFITLIERLRLGANLRVFARPS